MDWVQRNKPGGGIDEIIEVLAASNPIVADANVMEGNLPTGHQHTERTSEPSGTWRLINKGIQPTKSTTEQSTDTCGILNAFSKVDADLAELNGDQAAFRASEDNAFVSGLSSQVATAIFYGDQGANPEQMHGLDKRYDSTSQDQVLSASGSGSDNTSIWFVTWGPQTASLIFPKGSPAGLQSNDLGKIMVHDSDTYDYMAWVTEHKWKLGLAVMDYRYVIRICNIDISNLTADAASGADLLDQMVDAYYARPTSELGPMLAKTFIYCNPTVAKFLHKQAQNKSNVNLTIDMPAGVPQVSFLGAPIHVCDNITETEATIS